MSGKQCGLPDKATRGWIVNTARKQYWRVAAFYDFEDLVQDGYLVYARCYARYGASLRDPDRQMMALLKVAYNNHINDLARKVSDTPEVSVSAITDQPETLEARLVAPPTVVTAAVETAQLLATAPTEIMELVKALIADGGVFLRRRRYRTRLFRETTNEYLCRLVGKDPTQTDLRSAVSNYFDV